MNHISRHNALLAGVPVGLEQHLDSPQRCLLLSGLAPGVHSGAGYNQFSSGGGSPPLARLSLIPIFLLVFLLTLCLPLVITLSIPKA